MKAAKDVTLDRVYWLRQAMAVVIGIAAGFFLTGLPGCIVFFALATVTPSLLFSKEQLQEKRITPSELLFEGVMPAFGTFLCLWVLTYSTLH